MDIKGYVNLRSLEPVTVAEPQVTSPASARTGTTLRDPENN
jgi:hypothetical protein